MTVQQIFNFLNQKYPVDTACGFDNVGILVGDPEMPVSKAVVALDCTTDAIKTAINNGCELIITHHPIIFSGLKSVLDDTLVFEIIKNGLTVISMHTNLDQGDGGVNDALCDVIGLKNIELLLFDGTKTNEQRDLSVEEKFKLKEKEFNELVIKF